MKLSSKQKRLVNGLSDYLESNYEYQDLMLKAFEDTSTELQKRNGTIVLSIKKGILEHEYDPTALDYGGNIDTWKYKIHINGYIRKATRYYDVGGGFHPEYRYACRNGIHASEPARWGKHIKKLIPMKTYLDYGKALLFINNDVRKSWKRLVTLRNERAD